MADFTFQVTQEQHFEVTIRAEDKEEALKFYYEIDKRRCLQSLGKMEYALVGVKEENPNASYCVDLVVQNGEIRRSTPEERREFSKDN